MKIITKDAQSCVELFKSSLMISPSGFSINLIQHVHK